MSTDTDHRETPPKLAPEQWEAAGRNVKTWLEGVIQTLQPRDTSIAWEDGEPKPDAPQPERAE